MAPGAAQYRYKFDAVSGVFADLEAGVYTTTQPGLGLIDRTYPGRTVRVNTDPPQSDLKPWQRFKTYVDGLNAESPETSTYKVLYIIRHGFGYHNEFMAKVGNEAWKKHWSHLDSDGSITWADSDLHPTGIEQAKTLSDFWSRATSEDMIPTPQSINTSPLSRCLETCRLVFEPVLSSSGQEFQPHVKEGLRERVTDHTCDRRRTKSWIESSYPNYVLDNDLTENDELWTGDKWETDAEHEARKRSLLEDIWSHDDSSFVALVTHSYAISAILGVVGLPAFRVKEGNCVALLVKGEKLPPTRLA